MKANEWNRYAPTEKITVSVTVIVPPFTEPGDVVDAIFRVGFLPKTDGDGTGFVITRVAAE